MPDHGKHHAHHHHHDESAGEAFTDWLNLLGEAEAKAERDEDD